MSTKRHVIQFMLHWLRLRTSKLFVFTLIFSFRFLVNDQYGHFSLQDNSVGSLLYVVFVKYLYFPYQHLPGNLVDANALLVG